MSGAAPDVSGPSQEEDPLDLVSKLTPEQDIELRRGQVAICPDDGKYAKEILRPYLSQEAEWRMCAEVQLALLTVRTKFGLAEQKNVDELAAAIEKIDPLNMQLIERSVTKHDQLAVIEELGRHVSAETKALLHPGTTSYDILDTARSALLKRVWKQVLRPEIDTCIDKLCDLAETFADVLQVGRTHLQNTSPVPFGATLAGYAARIAERSKECDRSFGSLRGKVSGIVGTGSSVNAVVGKDRGISFESVVLDSLDLKPDYTATQIVQKEQLADVGHSLVTLMRVLGNFANDMRILYSSAINEVTSRSAAQRLGGSSADAAKNNPINWENIAGKVAIVQSGMHVLYELMSTDLQRDLRGSVQARYQPQLMIAEVYEAFTRASRGLDTLSVNKDRMEENLTPVREFPSEAMVAILRGHGFKHPHFGIGHDTVKIFAQMARSADKPLLEVALEDPHFAEFYGTLNQEEQLILAGRLQYYTGSASERMEYNINYARNVIDRTK